MNTVFTIYSGRHRVRRRRPTAALAGGSALALAALALMATSPQHASAAPNGKVTLCHATPPASAKNGWVRITVSTNAVTHAGHGRHADDIIPAFTYSDKGAQRSYPGMNLSTDFGGMTGQDILANGCSSNSSQPSGGSTGSAKHHAGSGKNHAGPGKNHSGPGNGRAHGVSHNGKVTLCHATPPATAKNGWVVITVSTNAVTHAGHGRHADDIIPAFTYLDKSGQHAYPGKNLDTDFAGMTGRQLLADGCAQPAPSSSSAASSGAPAGTAPAGGSPVSTGTGSGDTSAVTSSQVEGVSVTRSDKTGGTGGTGGAAGTGTGRNGGTGVEAAQATASPRAAAVAPAGAHASGLAVGDTGDAGSSGGTATAAAVVGASLAALIGLGALAVRRRRPDAGA